LQSAAFGSFSTQQCWWHDICWFKQEIKKDRLSRGQKVSKKDAFVFLRVLAQDPLLSKRLLSGGKEEVIKAIDEAGLSLTWEELEAVVREIKGSGDEVSDDVLDLIAGGLSFGQIQEWVRVNLDKLYSPFSKK
jgi:hypothetical protein